MLGSELEDVGSTGDEMTKNFGERGARACGERQAIATEITGRLRRVMSVAAFLLLDLSTYRPDGEPLERGGLSTL